MLRIDHGGRGTIRPTETPFETLLSAFVLVEISEQGKQTEVCAIDN